MSNRLTGTPAQSIGDVAEKAYNVAKKIGGMIANPGHVESSAPTDTSWHDQMVREANAGFAKAAAQTTHDKGHARVKSKYGITPHK